jgi:hypothetical protein
MQREEDGGMCQKIHQTQKKYMCVGKAFARSTALGRHERERERKKQQQDKKQRRVGTVFSRRLLDISPSSTICHIPTKVSQTVREQQRRGAISD